MNRKYYIYQLLCFMLLLCSISCTNDDSEGHTPTLEYLIRVKKISLNQNTIEIYVGETFQLISTTSPTEASSNVSWRSSTSCVEVSNTGLLTAKSSGKATITATAMDGSEIKATCDVIVKPTIFVQSITLSEDSLSLVEGYTYTLSATVSPFNATNKSLTWSSNTPEVAAIDDNGVITAKAAGLATITAKANDGSGIERCCRVMVNPIVLVSDISLNMTSLSLFVGDTDTLCATILPSNASDKSISWSSNNYNVASVDQKGVIAAIAAGSARITAKANDGSGVEATCEVIVKPYIPVQSIILNYELLTIAACDTFTLTATISPSNASNKSITWYSKNPSVATIDNSGKITPRKIGSTTIIVKANDKSGVETVCNITVISGNSINMDDYDSDNNWN